MTNKFLPWIWRVPFTALILFELLVVLEVLDIKPDFTKFGLLITSTAVLVLLELPYRHAIKNAHVHLHWWVPLPAVLTVLFDAGGDFLHFYSRFPNYDTIMHYMGALSAATYIWHVFGIFYHTKIVSKTISDGLLMFLTFTTTISFGVLYEMEEYLEDVVFHSSRLGDGPDTGNDLTMDMLGALTVIALVLWHEKSQKKKTQIKKDG